MRPRARIDDDVVGRVKSVRPTISYPTPKSAHTIGTVELRKGMEIGVSGVRTTGGTINDEFISKLRGQSGRSIYYEMSQNDSIIGAILFSIEMLIRAVEWSVVPKGIDGVATESQKESIEWTKNTLFKDMDLAWDDFIADVLSMLTYGWSYFEKVYYNDKESGTVKIRKLGLRKQNTLLRWEIGDHGEIRGMWQMPPSGPTGTVLIPMSKALLFRPLRNADSPEGQSVLRTAYRTWYMLKNIQEIEGIAIERELNGLPIIRLPHDLMVSEEAGDIAVVEKYKEVVRAVKLNEQGGLVLPSNPYVNEDGDFSNMRQVEFELVNAGGSRAIDTNAVIKRYQFDMASTVLANFIVLGGVEHGSFAMSESKTNLFVRAIEGWLETISSVINRDLIPDLWKVNGFSDDTMPKVTTGNVLPENLEEFGRFVKEVAAAGMPLFPDETLEEHIRDRAGLPEKDMEEGMGFFMNGQMVGNAEQEERDRRRFEQEVKDVSDKDNKVQVSE